MRVAVTRRIEPVSSLMLAVSRRVEQLLDELVVSLRRLIRDEHIDLGGCRRQAGEIKRQPANQRDLVRLRRWLQSRLVQLREHKTINRILDPRFIADLRQLRSSRRDERPVRLVLGPFVDPTLERRDLFRRNFLTGRRRRHLEICIVSRQPSDDFTLGPLTGNDADLARFKLRGRSIALIESQSSLPLFFIGAVTLEAIVGQDRSDIAAELKFFGRRVRSGQHRRRGGDSKSNTNPQEPTGHRRILNLVGKMSRPNESGRGKFRILVSLLDTSVEVTFTL